MKFGIHNPSWVYGSDPADAFEAVKAEGAMDEDGEKFAHFRNTYRKTLYPKVKA
jgi:hypothetical protein